MKTEKCMSIYFCCGTGLKVSRDNIQIMDTHTYITTAYFCYTMSVTHPTTRTQHITMCHPFRAGANCSSTQGNLLLLLNSSILLKHDECSPQVLLCMCKILPQVHVEISRCHCKKGTWKCSVLHQLSNPSESHYVM